MLSSPLKFIELLLQGLTLRRRGHLLPLNPCLALDAADVVIGKSSILPPFSLLQYLRINILMDRMSSSKRSRFHNGT
jgi:hypothetical protein